LIPGPKTDNDYHPVVPPRYRGHPLVANRVFFTLPPRLLRPLVAQCGKKAFKPESLHLEGSLTDRISHNKCLVGYNALGEGLEHHLLPFHSDPLPNPSNSTLERIGWSRSSYDRFLQEAPKRLEPYREALRGYLGWLVTNPLYLSERDALFETWRDQINHEGIPQSGPTVFGSISHHELVQRVVSSTTVDFLTEFARFYARWRLQHLVARDLPMPLGPQLPITHPLTLLTHMRAGGVSLYQPDTVMIPSRDTLRDTLEDIRVHQLENGHLSEWTDIIRKSRSSNHTVHKYGQILNLHFYWSLLEQRHPALFKGRRSKIQAAFGDYLGVDTRAIEKARQQINVRLRATL